MRSAQTIARMAAAGVGAFGAGAFGAALYGLEGLSLAVVGLGAGWLNGFRPLRWAASAIAAGAGGWGGGASGWFAGLAAGALAGAAVLPSGGGAGIASGATAAFYAACFGLDAVAPASARKADFARAALAAGTVVAMGWFGDFLARNLAEREIRAGEARKAARAQPGADIETDRESGEPQAGDAEGQPVEGGEKARDLEALFEQGKRAVEERLRREAEAARGVSGEDEPGASADGSDAAEAAQIEGSETMIDATTDRIGGDVEPVGAGMSEEGRLARILGMFVEVSEAPEPYMFDQAFAVLAKEAAAIARAPGGPGSGLEEIVRRAAAALSQGGAQAEAEERARLKTAVGLVEPATMRTSAGARTDGGEPEEAVSDGSGEEGTGDASAAWTALLAGMRSFADGRELAEDEIERRLEGTGFEAGVRTSLNSVRATMEWLEAAASPADCAPARRRLRGLLEGRDLEGISDPRAAAVRSLLARSVGDEGDAGKRMERVSARLAALAENERIDAAIVEMARLAKLEKPDRNDLRVGETLGALATWLAARCGWGFVEFLRWRERSAMSRAAVLARAKDRDEEAREIGQLLQRRRMAEALVSDAPDSAERRRRFEVIGYCARVGQFLTGVASRMLREEERGAAAQLRVLGFRLKKRAFEEAQALRAMHVSQDHILKTAAGFAMTSADQIAYLANFGERADGERLPEEVLAGELAAARAQLEAARAAVGEAEAENARLSERSGGVEDFYRHAVEAVRAGNRFFSRELDRTHLTDKSVPNFPGVNSAAPGKDASGRVAKSGKVRVFMSQDDVKTAEQLIAVAGKAQESLKLSNNLGSQTESVRYNAASVEWTGNIPVKGEDGKPVSKETTLKGIEAMEKIAAESKVKNLVKVSINLHDVLENLSSQKRPDFVGPGIANAMKDSQKYVKAAENVVANEAQKSRERGVGAEAGVGR